MKPDDLHLQDDFYSSKHVKSDRYRPASESPFRWRFVGRPIVARDRILPGKGSIKNKLEANRAFFRLKAVLPPSRFQSRDLLIDLY